MLALELTPRPAAVRLPGAGHQTALPTHYQPELLHLLNDKLSVTILATPIVAQQMTGGPGLATTDLIPHLGFLAAPSIDTATRTALCQALLSTHTSEDNKKMLKQMASSASIRRALRTFSRDTGDTDAQDPCRQNTGKGRQLAYGRSAVCTASAFALTTALLSPTNGTSAVRTTARKSSCWRR